MKSDKDVDELNKKIDQLIEEVKDLKKQLAEKQDKFPMMVTSPAIVDYSTVPPACRNCPNHPINGGSGICHCILGLQQVTC